MPQLMTQSEYARHRKAAGMSGGTPAAVLKAIRTGRISLIDGKIDPAVADVQWNAHTRKRADLHVDQPATPASAAQATQAAPSSYADAKTRSEEATAALKELELAKKIGTIVDKAGVERAAYQFGRILQKTLVDVMPSKVAMELATMTDPWSIECYLREKVRAELAAVSKMSTEEVEIHA
jgi:hypothetical protein